MTATRRYRGLLSGLAMSLLVLPSCTAHASVGRDRGTSPLPPTGAPTAAVPDDVGAPATFAVEPAPLSNWDIFRCQQFATGVSRFMAPGVNYVAQPAASYRVGTRVVQLRVVLRDFKESFDSGVSFHDCRTLTETTVQAQPVRRGRHGKPVAAGKARLIGIPASSTTGGPYEQDIPVRVRLKLTRALTRTAFMRAGKRTKSRMVGVKLGPIVSLPRAQPSAAPDSTAQNPIPKAD